MKRIICCFPGLFLALHAIPSSIENKVEGFNDFTKIASNEEWKIENEKILKRETISLRREIDANAIGCSRYCVQKRILDGVMENESLRRVNIIWNIVNEADVTLTEESSTGRGASSSQEKYRRWEYSYVSSEKSDIFYPDDPKCELYIELGCESYAESDSNISTIFDKFSNSNEKKLVSINDTVGHSSTVFRVSEVTEKLTIFTMGKLSQAILEIPIAPRQNDFANGKKTRPTFSLSRTTDATGVRIDARNPPAGEWRLKLLGMENLNYSFVVMAISSKKIGHNVQVQNEPTTARLLTDLNLENKLKELDVNVNEKLSRPLRLAYLRENDDNDAETTIKSSYEQFSVVEHLSNDSKVEESSLSKERKFLTKLSKQLNLEAELMESEIGERTMIEDEDENARIYEGTELDELSRAAGDIRWTRPTTVVDLNRSTQLLARPGTFHDIIFTVKNNQALGMRHTFKGSSSQFPYVGVYPLESWIRAGETVNVIVRINVPNIQDSTPNTVTLYVAVDAIFEVVQKSTYIYVQGSNGAITTDNDKPNIDYSFNDNCAGKLHRDRCAKSRWSVDINANDPDSGLKKISSLPSGVQPRTEFIAGTRNIVSFYYTATCCETTVDITATDVQGNSYTRTIDVTAWDNLNQGEIAAIVVGALLILLLIILIILIVIYCVRKRQSHDLSYSQRYGSRTPASAERTNF